MYSHLYFEQWSYSVGQVLTNKILFRAKQEECTQGNYINNM